MSLVPFGVGYVCRYLAHTEESIGPGLAGGLRPGCDTVCVLTAALGLAGLLRGRGRSADAIACLQPIYDRFSEGFGTPILSRRHSFWTT